MRCVVLTSKPDSAYADTPTTYEYPARYRQFFEPLKNGEPMLAIIYEPLDKGRGRMAYVGWAALTGTPTRSVRSLPDGSPLWQVAYLGRAEEFPHPVARDQAGEPIEAWLRAMPPANRSIRTSGASVRWLPEAEAQAILALGHAGQLAVSMPIPEAVEHPDDGELTAERSRRLLTAVERDARFRRAVMSAYEFRCAVSSFGIGPLPQGRASHLIEAAHIRPVSQRGPDVVPNGLALTPTLHRLFDEGLFTLQRSGPDLTLTVSPLLETTMIESPDGRFRLPLETGLPVSSPADIALRPSDPQLRFHQRMIFKGPESLLT